MTLNNPLTQTVLYGFSIALMKGISLIMLPFIANHLSQQAFGQLEVLSSLAIIGSILVGLGLEDTLYRFAGQASSAQQRKQYAANIFGFSLIFGLLALCIGWFIAPLIVSLLPGQIQLYEVRLVLIMLALEGIIAVPLGWLRMQNKVLSFALLTISRAALQALLIILMISANNDIAAVLEAGVIAAISQALILSYLQYRDTGITFNIKKCKPIFIYSLPIVATGLVAFILNGFDRWILADQTSLIDLAHYGVAAKFALSTVLLLQPFNMWWSPKRFEILQQVDGTKKALNMIQIGISLILIISVLIGTSAPVLITWLMPDNYQMATQYVIGLVLVMLLKELSELINIGCFINGSTIKQFWINLGSVLIGLISMLLTVQHWAVWGIIASLILAQAFKLIGLFILSQQNKALNYNLIAILFLTAQATSLMVFSSNFKEIQHAIIFSIMATLFMVLSAVCYRLTPFSIKRFIQKKYKKKSLSVC